MDVGRRVHRAITRDQIIPIPCAYNHYSSMYVYFLFLTFFFLINYVLEIFFFLMK